MRSNKTDDCNIQHDMFVKHASPFPQMHLIYRGRSPNKTTQEWLAFLPNDPFDIDL